MDIVSIFTCILASNTRCTGHSDLDLLNFSESPSGHWSFGNDKVINNCFGYILTRADEPHDKLQGTDIML